MGPLSTTPRMAWEAHQWRIAGFGNAAKGAKDVRF